MLYYYHNVGVEIELDSEGVIDITEGVFSLNSFSTEGFSYGYFTITIFILTYSEYEERGYNLANDFESDEIPANAANGLFSVSYKLNSIIIVEYL